jgi:hypothetical protein
VDIDDIKKWVAIVAAAVPIVLGSGAWVTKQLDTKFVPRAEYDKRLLKLEISLEELRINSAIQILDNRRVILEEKLRILDPKDIHAVMNTRRDVEAIIEEQANWVKMKNAQR